MMNPTAETWAMMTSEFSLRCVFALFHFLWQGTLLGCAVTVAIALLRNEPASVRYWLTATGLFACPLCVAITFCSISPPRETQHRQNSVIAKQVGSNAAGVTNNTKGTSVPQSYLEPNSKPEPLVSVFQKDKFLSVASENLNLLLAKFSGGVFCVYAICVSALLLRLGTGIVGSGRLRLATWTLADPSNFLQPKQSNAMHGLPVQQVEARSVDEANEDLQEIDGITAQLTIKYHIPGGEDTARILVFDDERRTFLGTSDEFYGKKGRINNVENGSEIQFNDLKPGEYHVCRIARAGQYSRTSLDRTTIHLKAGDARSIEITRPSGKHIVGRVVNRNAFQLRHVQVWVCPALDDSIWRFRDATSHNLCGEDGSFTTDLVSPGKYLVFVEGYERPSVSVPNKYFVVPGYTGVAEVTVPAEGEPKPVAIELKNMLEDPTWNGQVKGKQSLDFMERMNPSWGTAEQGLQFGISHGTDRRGFREGERISVAMFVRNTSNELRLVSVSNDFDSEVVDLTDSDGKSIPVQQFAWYPSLDGGRFSSCFSEMLEPGEVMAFRLPGLGLALPKSPEIETQPLSFGPAPDRPNWSAPTVGKYSLKQSKTIRFGITDDHSNLSDIRLSTGSIQFEALERGQWARNY